MDDQLNILDASNSTDPTSPVCPHRQNNSSQSHAKQTAASQNPLLQTPSDADESPAISESREGEIHSNIPGTTHTSFFPSTVSRDNNLRPLHDHATFEGQELKLADESPAEEHVDKHSLHESSRASPPPGLNGGVTPSSEEKATNVPVSVEDSPDKDDHQSNPEHAAMESELERNETRLPQGLQSESPTPRQEESESPQSPDSTILKISTAPKKLARRSGFMSDSASELESENEVVGTRRAKSSGSKISRCVSTTSSTQLKRQDVYLSPASVTHLQTSGVVLSHEGQLQGTFSPLKHAVRSRSPENDHEHGLAFSRPGTSSYKDLTASTFAGNLDTGKKLGHIDIGKARDRHDFDCPTARALTSSGYESTPIRIQSKKRSLQMCQNQDQTSLDNRLHYVSPTSKRVKITSESTTAPEMQTTISSDQDQILYHATVSFGNEEKEKGIEPLGTMNEDEYAEHTDSVTREAEIQAARKTLEDERHKQALCQEHKEKRRVERERVQAERAEAEGSRLEEENNRKALARKHELDRIRVQDAKDTDMKRELAMMTIKKRELEKQVEKLTRQNSISDTEYQALSVQRDLDLLADLKTRQDESKKQAASLKINKKVQPNLPIVKEDGSTLSLQISPPSTSRQDLSSVLNRAARPLIPSHSEVTAATKAKMEQDRLEERARKRERDAAKRAEQKSLKEAKIAELKAKAQSTAAIVTPKSSLHHFARPADLSLPATASTRKKNAHGFQIELSEDESSEVNTQSHKISEEAVSEVVSVNDTQPNVAVTTWDNARNDTFVSQYHNASINRENRFVNPPMTLKNTLVNAGQRQSVNETPVTYEKPQNSNAIDSSTHRILGLPKNTSKLSTNNQGRFQRPTEDFETIRLAPIKQKPTRTAAQQQARREKQNEVARNKKLTEIQANNAHKGISMSEAEIERLLDVYMEKRAKSLERRQQQHAAQSAKASQNGVLFAKPDGAPYNLEKQKRKNVRDKDYIEGDLFNVHKLQRPTIDPEKSPHDPSLGDHFRRRTIATTVKELQSRMPRLPSPTVPSSDEDDSSMSEEDPDSDFKKLPRSMKSSKAAAANDIEDEREVELEDINGSPEPAHSPSSEILGEHNQSFEEQSSRSSSLSRVFTNQLGSKSSSRATSFSVSTRSSLHQESACAPGDENQIHVYLIYENKITPDSDATQDPSLVERFLDRDLANEHARLRFSRYKTVHPDIFPSIIETFNSVRCYQASIWFDGEKEQNGIEIWVKRIAQSSDTLTQFNNLEPKQLFPNKAYVIRRTITKTYITKEGTTQIVKDSNILPGKMYTSLISANTHACKHAINFLRPTRPNLNYVDIYNDKVVPFLEQHRDTCNAGQVMSEGEMDTEIQGDPQMGTFGLDLTDADNIIFWMDPVMSFGFKVEEFEVCGPLN